jgi:nitrate reductase gamma subunit
MVTSKMDVVVYLTLLTQIISGLMVAYYSRWGSSWFSAFLTPYLRSIFVFDPQIDAISSVNSLALKVHVISAFSIIGIIPFTRFIHFLVYPVDYLWRSYQQVIWNWDRRNIRTSRFWKRGIPSKNN